MADKMEFACHDCKHEYEYTPGTGKACPKCGSKNSHPTFVKIHRELKKNFEISVNEKYNDPDHWIIQLRKWWFAGGGVEDRKININTPEEWDGVKQIIDIDLGPLIGWQTPQEADTALFGVQQSSEDLKKTVQQYPRRVLEFLEALDWDKLTEDGDMSLTADFVNEAGELFDNAGDQLKLHLKDFLQNISVNDAKALGELNDLLQDWRLIEITSLSMMLLNRLKTIELFEDMILNDGTYEITGDNSIHDRLERNLWLLDEDYWLLQSNRSLKTFIGERIAKKDEKLARKRPDFVCASHKNQLIIVEIKRPSHTANKDDLDQLEQYLLAAEEYEGENYNKQQGFLIGNKFSPEAKKLAKNRKNMQIITYNEIIKRCKERYQDYLHRLSQLREEADSLQANGNGKAKPRETRASSQDS